MISRTTQYAVRFINIKTILLLFVVLATVYSVVTPLFEASDELWHYPLVQWLGQGQPLPGQPQDNDSLSRQSLRYLSHDPTPTIVPCTCQVRCT